jgi:hypothetical protein
MGKEAPAWAQVGAAMIEVRSGIGRTTYGDTSVKIAARLKNGNVRLEGSDAQWRCGHDGTARRAGDGYSYGHLQYQLLTPELKSEADKARRVDGARRKVRVEADRLELIWRHGDDDAILDAAAAIAKAGAAN